MAWVQQGLLVGLVAGVAASAGVWLVQPNGPGAPPTLADAAARLEKRFESLEKLTPGPGLFMTSAQMHFAKLYYAIQYENWDLAKYEIDQLRERLDQSAIALPEKNGVNVVALTDAMKTGVLAKIENDVVGKRDPGGFKDLYLDAIQSCNACHGQTGFGCIRIAVPSAPPVYTQDWRPQGK
jgi:hypothetical protein